MEFKVYNGTDYYNKSFKIIDMEKREIICSVDGEHTKEVYCIKKLDNPVYCESLLSCGEDKSIKLWNM